MKLKNKKGSELVTNKLIILILVVLVVLVILVFAFRSDVLSWIKNLPGFKEPVNQEIDLTTLSPSELANMGYTCEADNDVKVMLLKGSSYGNAAIQLVTADYREVYFFNNDPKIPLVKSQLLMKMNSGVPESLVISGFSSLSIGSVVSRILRVNDNAYAAFITKDSSYNSGDSIKIRAAVGSKDILDNIDQSYSIGGSLFCKKKSILPRTTLTQPIARIESTTRTLIPVGLQGGKNYITIIDFVQNKDTNKIIIWLYIQDNSIFVAQKDSIGPAKKIGSITNDVIVMDSDVLSNDQSYRNTYSFLPSKEILDKLNGARVDLAKKTIYK